MYVRSENLQDRECRSVSWLLYSSMYTTASDLIVFVFRLSGPRRKLWDIRDTFWTGFQSEIDVV